MSRARTKHCPLRYPHLTGAWIRVLSRHRHTQGYSNYHGDVRLYAIPYHRFAHYFLLCTSECIVFRIFLHSSGTVPSLVNTQGVAGVTEQVLSFDCAAGASRGLELFF